jgi:hypothetical protein
VRRGGSFHDDQLIHGTLDAHRHVLGEVCEGMMSIAEEAVPGMKCWLKYRCMAM